MPKQFILLFCVSVFIHVHTALKGAQLMHHLFAVIFLVTISFATTKSISPRWVDFESGLDQVHTSTDRLSTNDLNKDLNNDFNENQPGQSHLAQQVTFKQFLGHVLPISNKVVTPPNGTLASAPVKWSIIGLHIFNTIFIYLILSLMFGSAVAAATGAILFAVHPGHAEILSFLNNGSILLACSLAFSSIYFYIRYQKARTKNWNQFRTTWKTLSASTLLYMGAVILWPLLICVPMIAGILQHFLPKSNAYLKPKTSSWPWLTWLALTPLYFIVATKFLPAFSMESLEFYFRPIDTLSNLSFYLYKALVPINIIADYSASLPKWLKYVSWMLPFILFGALAVARRMPTRIAFSGLLLFCIAIIPASGLVEWESSSFQKLSNRNLYFPLLGLCLAAGGIIEYSKRLSSSFAIMIILSSFIWLNLQTHSIWSESSRLWEVTLKANPHSSLAHWLAAKSALADTDYETADQHLRILYEQYGDQTDLLTLLGQVREAKNLLPEALTLYNKALAKDSDDTGLKFALGRVHYKLEEYAKAQTLLEDVVHNDQEKIEAWSMLGKSYIKLREPDRAKQAFQTALSLSQRHEINWTNEDYALLEASLAYSLAKTGNLKEAYQYSAKAESRNIKTADVQRRLGDFYFAANEYAKALSYYQPLEEFYENDAEYQESLGMCYLEKQNYTKALATFRKVLDANPSNKARLHTLLGKTYFRLRDFDQSSEHLDKALALNPKNADALYFTGDIARWHGKQSVAIQKFYEAIAIEPRHGDAHYRIGTYFLRQNKNAEALKHLRIAAESEPSEERFQNQLQRAQLRMKSGSVW